jgi:thiamine transporter ThiT
MNTRIKKLTASGVCLALAMLLPFLTGQIPQIGMAISPMHIPVLICGFVSGWHYGLVIGFLSPLLRSLMFGMPALFPNAIGMAFELAAYGAAAGLIYKLLPKKVPSIYAALISAMLIGRVIWGTANYAMSLLFDFNFTFTMFLSGAFITAIPGIIIHILLVPVIVIALKKARLLWNE